MRKTIVIFLMIVAMTVVTGCGGSTSISHEVYSNHTETVSTSNNKFEFQSTDGSRVTVSGDVRFVPVEKEDVFTNFDNLYMYTFVDLETGNMYLYTEKRVGSSNGRGFGTTFTLLPNSDGTPCVYEDLESLREFYNYK